MDPNLCLTTLRAWAKGVLDDEDCYSEETVDVANLVLSLDEWIIKGGFLPTDWSENR